MNDVMQENSIGTRTAPGGPVKITLKTSLCNNPLIGRLIDVTASPSRTVHSLKQSVSRQFKPRPIDVIVLHLNGQAFDDDTLVQDLVQDIDDEDDEDDNALPKLTILVDMVPPVDVSKYGLEMKEKIDSMTNEET